MARTLEILCETANDCYAAERGGADRIELCAACEVGGLTPSLGSVLACLAATKLPIASMLRNRPGGFEYSAVDQIAMAQDAEIMVKAGVQYLVFGALTGDRNVDEEACRRLMSVAPQSGWVFHRAFDLAEDWERAMEVVIDLGFKRILTSGGARTAPEGLDRLHCMLERAQGRIEIMAGGGVRPQGVESLVRTGIESFHASAWGSIEHTDFGSERRTVDSSVRALRSAIDAAS